MGPRTILATLLSAAWLTPGFCFGQSDPKFVLPKDAWVGALSTEPEIRGPCFQILRRSHRVLVPRIRQKLEHGRHFPELLGVTETLEPTRRPHLERRRTVPRPDRRTSLYRDGVLPQSSDLLEPFYGASRSLLGRLRSQVPVARKGPAPVRGDAEYLERQCASDKVLALVLVAGMGDEADQFVDDIVPLLSDKDPRLARQAGWTLGRIGHAARPALLKWLRGNPLTMPMLDAFRELGPFGARTLIRNLALGDDDLKPLWLELLSWVGPEHPQVVAKPLARFALRWNEADRLRAFEILLACGAGGVEGYRILMASERSEDRQFAITGLALAERPIEELTPLLVRWLPKADPTLAEVALRAFALRLPREGRRSPLELRSPPRSKWRPPQALLGLLANLLDSERRALRIQAMVVACGLGRHARALERPLRRRWAKGDLIERVASLRAMGSFASQLRGLAPQWVHLVATGPRVLREEAAATLLRARRVPDRSKASAAFETAILAEIGQGRRSEVSLAILLHAFVELGLPRSESLEALARALRSQVLENQVLALRGLARLLPDQGAQQALIDTLAARSRAGIEAALRLQKGGSSRQLYMALARHLERDWDRSQGRRALLLMTQLRIGKQDSDRLFERVCDRCASTDPDRNLAALALHAFVGRRPEVAVFLKESFGTRLATAIERGQRQVARQGLQVPAQPGR